ncbi:MAG: InlB B-repeat-containing protein [Limisphaerales bacterium]
MVALNTELSVQSKTGTPLFTTTLSNFWQAEIGINGRVNSPRLTYDPANDRWIHTACANPQSPNSALLLAISATSDPTLTWFKYRIFIDFTNNVTWGSDDNVGFNDDWIVVSKNLRFNGGNTFNRSRVYVFDKNQLFQPLPPGNILNTNVLRTVIEEFTVSSLVPAVSYDSSPGQLFLIANGIGNDGFGNGNVRLFRLTESTNIFSLTEIAQPAANSAWSDVPNTATADFLPQRDSSALISAGDSRIQNLVLRNGSLWCAQSVFLPAGNGTRAAAQWWEINPSGTVVQFGRVDDATGVRHFAYPSIGVNRNSDVMLGYSAFSATDYPSASYSFRFATDPLNFLQSEEVYKTGESSYLKSDPVTGANTWGEYSATAVDPLNDLDLWTIQEYASTPVAGIDRWGTWWGMVDLSTPPDGNLEVVVSPPSGSLIPAGLAQTFTARVFDTLGVTNATVDMEAPGLFTTVTFVNNGLPPDALANDQVYTRAINLPVVSTNLQAIFTVRATGKNTLTFTNIYTVAPPPGNDFFAGAFKIPERLPETNGIVNGGNFFASVEANEPLHAGVAARGNSVWWNWAPVQSGPVLIDTLGSGFNTVLAVYTNNNIANLAEVVSANDVTNEFGQFVRDKAFVKFNAIAGHTYRIAVAGTDTNQSGVVRLRMAFNGDQDVTQPQIAITNMITTNLTAGTVSITNPPSGLIVNQPILTISGTALDPNPDSSGVELIQIVGNDGVPVQTVPTNDIWSSTLILQPGSNLLQITAFDTAKNRSDLLSFAVTLRAFNPVNDIFKNAAPLTNFSGAVTNDNRNATVEGNEPLHAGKIGGKSIWFSFVPTADGVLSLSTTNSTIDTIMSLYSGTRINDLAVVAANDDAGPTVVHSEVISGVFAGQEYRIAIDGLDAAAGNVILHYNFEASKIFSLTVDTTQGGAVIPGSGAYRSGDPVVLTALTNTGFDFVSWTGDLLSLDNPLVFNIQSNMALTAVFGRRSISDDFESMAFNPGVAWAGSWSVQATDATFTNTVFGGSYFARSGIVDHNGSSEQSVTGNMRAGQASFSYKVSTEPNFDFFEFNLNGTNLLRESGNSDWRSFTFDVPAGTNTVTWRYLRDHANDGGFDAAFIDNVDLPLLSLVDSNVTISMNTNALRFAPGSTNTFTVVALPNGASTNYGFFSNAVFISLSDQPLPFTDTNVVINQFQFRVEGQTNQLYRIQASDDLGNWVTLETNHAPFGIIQFTDQQSTNHQRRYYRAVSLD